MKKEKNSTEEFRIELRGHRRSLSLINFYNAEQCLRNQWRFHGIAWLRIHVINDNIVTLCWNLFQMCNHSNFCHGTCTQITTHTHTLLHCIHTCCFPYSKLHNIFVTCKRTHGQKLGKRHILQTLPVMFIFTFRCHLTSAAPATRRGSRPCSRVLNRAPRFHRANINILCIFALFGPILQRIIFLIYHWGSCYMFVCIQDLVCMRVCHFILSSQERVIFVFSLLFAHLFMWPFQAFRISVCVCVWITDASKYDNVCV